MNPKEIYFFDDYDRFIKCHLDISDTRTVSDYLEWFNSLDNKIWQVVAYQETAEKTQKPHLQCLFYWITHIIPDTKQIRRQIRNKFDYKFKTKNIKETGKSSFSRFDNLKHLNNYKEYITKDQTLVFNNLFTEDQLTLFHANYIKHKTPYQKAKILKKNITQSFLDYIDENIPIPDCLDNVGDVTIDSNFWRKEIIKLCISYLFKENQVRNGSAQLIRGYVLLAFSHLSTGYHPSKSFYNHLIQKVQEII